MKYISRDPTLCTTLINAALQTNTLSDVFIYSNQHVTRKADVIPQCFNYEKVYHYFLNYSFSNV